jgi:hypothetical protein
MENNNTKQSFTNKQSVIVAILGLVFVVASFAAVSWFFQAKDAHGYEIFWQFGSLLAAAFAATCAIALAATFKNSHLNQSFIIGMHVIAAIPIMYILFCLYIAAPEMIKLLK